ncbi:MAG: hypothetical protein WHT08_13300 [Bryobacteraceae bacterium]|jgi:hypothetical protein
MTLRLWTATCFLFSALTASASITESDEGCLYTPAELEAALGMKVQKGKGTVMKWSGGKSTTCMYSAGMHGILLSIETLNTPGGFGGSNDFAGGKEAIPGDPDKAFWQVNQGDLTDVALTYVRGNSRTQIRVSGVNQKDKAAVQAMRAKVLKLRRVP